MEQGNRKLREVIDRLISGSIFLDSKMSHLRKPGALIERLSPEAREELKKAKAEDFNHPMMMKWY